MGDEINDRIDGESTISVGIHVHESDVRVDIGEGEAVAEQSKDDADKKSGHDGVFVFVLGFGNVGANGEGRNDDAVNALKRVGESEDIDEVFVDE